MFPRHISEKVIFCQTNTSHLILSVKRTNYQIDKKASAKSGNLQQYTGLRHG